jgi:para-aminobenzoate synthetase / 4-amino-4-deoxychorismate lyase
MDLRRPASAPPPRRTVIPPQTAARFDDLTSRGKSLRLTCPRAVFAARAADEVRDSLRAAEAAAAAGHWVAGYVAYEALAAFEPSVQVHSWPIGHDLADLPLTWFCAFERREDAQPPAAAQVSPVEWTLDRSRAWHEASVRDAREAISVGAVYQLNLTARATARIRNPNVLYAGLGATQRGGFHALIDTGDHAIVSASPELFFERRGSLITTRPMKGTTGRGVTPHHDAALIARLRSSTKERAENTMIVDLLRNDLARLTRTGSVAVSDFLCVETFPTLHQLTSTVSAELAEGVDLAAIFQALFPSGSVTGAPKISAMRLINGLEGRPRGVYCGAIGYLAPDGAGPHARFSVAIRTATVSRFSGFAEYGTGGGITWSSSADAEWAEMLMKTKILGELAPRRQLGAREQGAHPDSAG